MARRQGCFPSPLPAFPAQSPASHQLQLLAQRKWLPAVAHSCFPRSVCCFQLNIPGSWIGTTRGALQCFPVQSLPGGKSFPYAWDGCWQGCSLLPALPGPWRENPLAEPQDGPCGESHGGGWVGATMSLETGACCGAWHSTAGLGDSTFGSMWHKVGEIPPGCEVVLSKIDGAWPTPRELWMGCEERVVVSPLRPCHSVPWAGDRVSALMPSRKSAVNVPGG